MCQGHFFRMILGTLSRHIVYTCVAFEEVMKVTDDDEFEIGDLDEDDGDYLYVEVVTCVSPSEVYVRTKDQAARFHADGSEMKRVMLQSLTSGNFCTDPHPGDFVVAAIKSSFYRGHVVSVHPSENICTVKLIDYGRKAEKEESAHILRRVLRI